MKCKNCGVEIEQKGNRIKEYCSDKCRMAHIRSNPNIQSEQNTVQSEQKEVKIQSEQVNPNRFPETDKFINGSTRYVRRENSVVDILPKDDLPLKVICECVWCGERFGANAAGKCALYCKYCKTAEQRKQVKEENEALWKSRLNTNPVPGQ